MGSLPPGLDNYYVQETVVYRWGKALSADDIVYIGSLADEDLDNKHMESVVEKKIVDGVEVNEPCLIADWMPAPAQYLVGNNADNEGAEAPFCGEPSGADGLDFPGQLLIKDVDVHLKVSGNPSNALLTLKKVAKNGDITESVILAEDLSRNLGSVCDLDKNVDPDDIPENEYPIRFKRPDFSYDDDDAGSFGDKPKEELSEFDKLSAFGGWELELTNGTIDCWCLEIVGSELEKSTLTVNVSGIGRVDKSPDQDTFYVDEKVTLTAVPEDGYVFQGWSGDASGSQNPIELAMTSNRSVTATFVEEPVTPHPTDNAIFLPVILGGSGAPPSTWYRPIDGMTMRFVPQGSFQMGSAAGDDREQPVHKVDLDAYWIDQTEVTNEKFSQFVADTGHEITAEELGSGNIFISPSERGYVDGADWQHPKGPGSNINGLGNHPVVLISWEDADVYCTWAGGRLPSEAEWEYAARGPANLTYPWGNTFEGEKANTCDVNCPVDWAEKSIDDGYAYTAPTGSYPQGGSWVWRTGYGRQCVGVGE